MSNVQRATRGKPSLATCHCLSRAASAKFISPRANLCRGRGRSSPCLCHTACHMVHTPLQLLLAAATPFWLAVHKPNCISLARPKGGGNSQWQLKPCRIICSASAHKYSMVLSCHAGERQGEGGEGVATCLDLWHSANFIMGQARTACLS